MDEAQHDPFLAFVDVAVGAIGLKDPEVDEESMRLVLLLHRVTNSLVYDLESIVHRPHGWSWASFRLLFALWVLGPQDAKTAASSSGMSRPAVTSLMRTLERDGLVQKVADPHDRRSVVISLTPQGQERLRAAYRLHNEREQAWMSTLTPEERVALVAILGKLSNTAQGTWANRR